MPYSTEDGPLTTSTRSAKPSDMNEATAPIGWAELKRMPSTSSTMESRFRPRMTGFCPWALSLLTERPGSLRSASPTFCAWRRDSSSRPTTDVAIGVLSRSAA